MVGTFAFTCAQRPNILINPFSIWYLPNLVTGACDFPKKQNKQRLRVAVILVLSQSLSFSSHIYFHFQMKMDFICISIYEQEWVWGKGICGIVSLEWTFPKWKLKEIHLEFYVDWYMGWCMCLLKRPLDIHIKLPSFLSHWDHSPTWC